MELLSSIIHLHSNCIWFIAFYTCFTAKLTALITYLLEKLAVKNLKFTKATI